MDTLESSNSPTGHFPPREVKAGTHSCVLSPHLKSSLAEDEDGKYGRIWSDLPAQDSPDAALMALSRDGAPMDATSRPGGEGALTDNPRIPAGFTFFGQFIAHDITADRSLLLHHANFNEVRNFRVPQLDLESVYAAGPSGNPYLYDMDDTDKFLIGINNRGEANDLPRNRQGRALIGDPRDDVHTIISQLHLAFLKFHNRVVDHVREQGTPAAEVFNQARRLVTWHYQWIAAHEFLPLTVGQELVSDIFANGPKFYSYDERPRIPVEFADAAYRFGHSQIRAIYKLNAHAQGRIFPECGGTCPVRADRAIDWSYFFNVDADRPPQASKRIDTQFAHSLIVLPDSVVGATDIPEQRSLAYRDLQRARALDLPSGEAVARDMGIEPLTPEEVGLARGDWEGETPLLYYILRESEVRRNGEMLGEVGGRIVAEVLLGLIGADPRSYLISNAENGRGEWTPMLPSSQEGDFTMADLIRFAGAAK
jgi:hypothetical protein